MKEDKSAVCRRRNHQPPSGFGNTILSRFIDSDFIWEFGKLPVPEHLVKYFIKIWKISAKIHKIGKIKAIFGFEMTPL